jgi:hypothetical protein
VAATGSFVILSNDRMHMFAGNSFWHECLALGRIFERTAQLSLIHLSAAISFVAAAPAPQTQYRSFQ